ncbi:hypothetical protein CCP3SC15_3680001 [Gammaproteobacteria bacterium]
MKIQSEILTLKRGKATILAFLLMAVFAVHAHAAFRNVLTIEVTSIASNGFSLTINGETKTTTNSLGATSIAASNGMSKEVTTTNLYRALVAYPFGVQQSVFYTNATKICITGGTNVMFTTAQQSNWLAFTTSSNLVYSAMAVYTPFTVQSNSVRQWQMSMLSTQLITYATNPLPEGSVVFSHFLTDRTNQTATNKTFVAGTYSGNVVALTNGFFMAPTISNSIIAEATLSGCSYTGNVGKLTNGAFFSPVLTNAIINTPILSNSVMLGTMTSTNLSITRTNGLALTLLGASPLSSSPGVAGQIMVDSSYLYICVSANTWKRIALTSF